MGKKTTLLVIILLVLVFNGCDNRNLLTQKNLNDIYYSIEVEEKCNEEFFNTEAPDKTIKYINNETGQEFKVPFNSKWGSKHFRINPYEVINKYHNILDRDFEEFNFGPMLLSSSCSWQRKYMMRAVPIEAMRDKDIDEFENKSSEKFLIQGYQTYRINDRDDVSLFVIGDSCLIWTNILKATDEDIDVVSNLLEESNLLSTKCEVADKEEETNIDNEDEEPKTFDHKQKFNGAFPMYPSSTLEIEGHKFFSYALTVETSNEITEDQISLIEETANATFCGGASPFADRYPYFLCLNTEAQTMDELIDIANKIAEFDFVLGSGPTSAATARADD